MFDYIETNVFPMFGKFIPVQSTGVGIKYKEERMGGMGVEYSKVVAHLWEMRNN
jgi:hypothetical protein